MRPVAEVSVVEPIEEEEFFQEYEDDDGFEMELFWCDPVASMILNTFLSLLLARVSGPNIGIRTTAAEKRQQANPKSDCPHSAQQLWTHVLAFWREYTNVPANMPPNPHVET